VRVCVCVRYDGHKRWDEIGLLIQGYTAVGVSGNNYR
jgi:hypothetical protein